jgi:DNA-binding response OmpR family regulator
MEQTFSPPPDAPLPWGYREEPAGHHEPAILVVEDDRDIRGMLSTLLGMTGYAVRTCATAEEALEALRAEPFDLVLTDYALPQRDGLWLIESASAEGLTEDLPILIITAHPHIAHASSYEVIPKPFDVEDLVDRIRRRTNPPRSGLRKPFARPSTDGGSSSADGSRPEPIELVLYVNARSPRSAAAVRSLRKAVARLNSPRAKLTICETQTDPCNATLERTTVGPRTYILGHITNPEPLLELLVNCDRWDGEVSS